LNPLLVKNYVAGAAVAARRIVKFSADRTVIQATGNTDDAIGVSSEVAAESGGRCDVIRSGLAEIELGGTVTRGQRVTSDANGKGVALALASVNISGVSHCQIGIAEVSGVNGDIIDVLVNPTTA
jgi:hypothetical protein